MRKGLKDVGAVGLGFLLVMGLFYVGTTPGVAAYRQEVSLRYQDRIALGRSSCAKAQESFEGRAAIGHELLIGGGMSVAFCYRIVQGPMAKDLITTDPPTVNTWAEGHLGWSFDGISSKVKGHGSNCANGHCWEYYYFRYYFKFTRGWGPAHQTCTPYINITVRGNGTYTTGHTNGGVC